MTIQEKLLDYGFVEGVDYTYSNNELTPIIKTRIIQQTVMVEVDGSYEEQVQEVEEQYQENLPELDTVRQQCIPDLALAISEYLLDKKELIDSENDSINIDDGKIIRFDFKNIPYPSSDELMEFYTQAKNKEDQKTINEQSLNYLKSTDWYIIREVDEGVPCPQEIKDLRASARIAIVR